MELSGAKNPKGARVSSFDKNALLFLSEKKDVNEMICAIMSDFAFIDLNFNQINIIQISTL